jgi:hypothetical protein
MRLAAANQECRATSTNVRAACGLEHANPALLRSLNFLCFKMCMKPSFGYNLVRIFPISFSKSALYMTFFKHLKCKSNSRYSLAYILPTSFTKSATRLQREANFWPRLSSRYSLVRFFVDIEARKRGNPTSATPGAKLSKKHTGFRAREGFHP